MKKTIAKHSAAPPCLNQRSSLLLGHLCDPRHGMRRPNCSTVAIPASATVTVTAVVEPSATGMSAPDDETSNRCATARGRMRSVVPVFSTDVAEILGDVRCTGLPNTADRGHCWAMGTKSRESIYGSSIRASAERARRSAQAGRPARREGLE